MKKSASADPTVPTRNFNSNNQYWSPAPSTRMFLQRQYGPLSPLSLTRKVPLRNVMKSYINKLMDPVAARVLVGAGDSVVSKPKLEYQVLSVIESSLFSFSTRQ